MLICNYILKLLRGPQTKRVWEPLLAYVAFLRYDNDGVSVQCTMETRCRMHIHLAFSMK